MMTQKPDRRVQKTKTLLKEALLSLILEKSYEKITVQQIIDRADVGRATFYNHYQDKEDLLLRGVGGMAYGHPVGPEGQRHSTPVPHAALSTAGMFAHAKSNQRLHAVMYARSKANPILEKVTAFLYKNVVGGLDRLVSERQSVVPLQIVAHFITGGLMAVIKWWHDEGYPYTPEEMDEFFQRLVMPGVREVVGE